MWSQHKQKKKITILYQWRFRSRVPCYTWSVDRLSFFLSQYLMLWVSHHSRDQIKGRAWETRIIIQWVGCLLGRCQPRFNLCLPKSTSRSNFPEHLPWAPPGVTLSSEAGPSPEHFQVCITSPKRRKMKALNILPGKISLSKPQIQ